VQEIEAAIRALSPEEKDRLAADLPRILPQLSSEMALQEVLAASGSLPHQQTAEEEELVHRAIADYHCRE